MNEEKYYTLDALEYISKLSDGGLRDSLTMLDKCISYNENITLENVVAALGAVNYYTMFDLNFAIFERSFEKVTLIIEDIHQKGLDLKQFIKQYMLFTLDVCKYGFLGEFDYLQIPSLYEGMFADYNEYEYDVCNQLLTALIDLNYKIKWETSPKAVIEASLIMFTNNFKE